jgi:hypothetical protein
MNLIELDKIKRSEVELEFEEEVFELIKEAEDFLSSFKWCKNIIKGWLAKDWGYILCIFYFNIEPTPGSKADNHVWFIVGDLPPAYIDIQSASTAYEALNAYTFLMEDWVINVRQGKSVEACYPIEVAPSLEYADMLSSRMNLIKQDFLPQIQQ